MQIYIDSNFLNLLPPKHLSQFILFVFSHLEYLFSWLDK